MQRRLFLLTLTPIATLVMLMCLFSGIQQSFPLLASPPVSPTGELRVCPSGCPYVSIQAAVDAANPGDVIKVAASVYTDLHNRPAVNFNSATDTVRQVVYLNKPITLQGGYTSAFAEPPDPAANPTVLDAQGQGRVIYAVGDFAATIDGFQIKGGNASGLGGGKKSSTDAGGGIYVISTTVTIRNSSIAENQAHVGGGLFLWFSDGTISHNRVYSNSVDDNAGGIYLLVSNVHLVQNTFESNYAGNVGGGGLIGHYSQAVMEGNHIHSNEAKTEGGGFYVWDNDSVWLRNTVESNVATRGGGFYLRGSSPSFQGNTVRNNTAYYGAGFYINHGSPLFANNFLVDNYAISEGAALGVYAASPQLLHNTIARYTSPDASALYITQLNGRSSVAMTNTILVRHSQGIHITEGNTATLRSTLWGAGPWTNGVNWTGDGTVVSHDDLAGDPLFVNPAGGDYHLSAGSAAINAGNLVSVMWDADQDPRPASSGYDVGADERPGASLHLDKTADFGVRNPDETIRYTIVVSSVGANPANAVQMVDDLPARQRVLNAKTSVGTCTTDGSWGGSVSCNLGSMASGTHATIELEAKTEPGVPDNLPAAMHNNVQVSSAETGNGTSLTTYLQNCHARINNAPAEYNTVQAAVDAAKPDDVIKISGYCAGVQERSGLVQQVYLDRSLALQGGWDTSFAQHDPVNHPTILDAQGQGRVFYIPEGVTASLQHLKLVRGSADNLGGGPIWFHIDSRYGSAADAGGGLYATGASLTMENSQVSASHAEYGGGVGVINSLAAILDSHIFSNTAKGPSHGYGGGLYWAESTITATGNTVAGNMVGGTYADGGGGFYGDGGRVVMRNNTLARNIALEGFSEGGGAHLLRVEGDIVKNSVSENETQGSGGGLYLHQFSGTVDDNFVEGNISGWWGGGISLDDSEALVTANTLQRNRTHLAGGGMYAYGGQVTIDGNLVKANRAESENRGAGGGIGIASTELVTLTNNVIGDNWSESEGSALLLESVANAQLVHNTLASNQGDSAIHVYGRGNRCGSAFLTNTILVNHTVGISVTANHTTTINGILWHNVPAPVVQDATAVVSVQNEVNGQPAFASDGYHLTAQSAAIDRGVETNVGIDIDGDTRPHGTAPDLGADEVSAALQDRLFLPVLQKQ